MAYPRIFQGFTFVFILGALEMGIGTEGYGQSMLYTDAGRQGDQYFEAQQYYRAAEYYEVAMKLDSTDYQRAFRLAESYRQQFNYQLALLWYTYVHQQAAESFPEAAYYRALMLKNLGRCDEAIPLFQELLNRTAFASVAMKKNAENALQGCYDKRLSNTLASSVSLQKLDSPVNSTFHDYAPLILQYDSVLAVTSTRFSDKRKRSYRFGENNANFFEFRSDTEGWTPQSMVSNAVNTKASEGSGCYVALRDEFYFTYCPENKPCEIQVVRKEKGKWTPPAPLNEAINQKNTNAKHPAVSGTGDTLFFVSDRPGGYGGMDLWMSLRVQDDEWAPPVCLDSLVNTTSDEVTPFYDSREDQLVFASNGHQGYGGMDLYLVTAYSNPTRRQRNHLPAPFNSSADDGYLVLGEQWGYLSSHRESDFDIYAFRKNASLSWQAYLLGSAPLANMEKNTSQTIYRNQVITADITFPGEIKDWIIVQSARHKRLESGATRFILNSDVNDIRFQQYRQQQRQDPKPASSAIAMSSGVNHQTDSVVVLATFSTDTLPEATSGVITGKVQFGAASTPLSKKTLQLRDEDGDLVKITTTNVLGNFRLVNIQPDANYSLVLAMDTLTDTMHVSNLQLRPLESDLLSQTFEPIYYDFNQDELRPEAKKVLESLAAFYRQHPSISIEINAFTDSSGNDQYNMLLSQKRGEAAFDYLIAQGVDRAALAINAKGVSTAYTSTNAFVSQQLNRRVEFELFGLEVPLASEVVTRMIRPNVALNHLLQSTGMTLEELQELNGQELDQLQPYKPLRVQKPASTDSDALFYQIININ